MTRTGIQATIAALSALLLVTACAHEARHADAGANAHNTPATAAAPAASPAAPAATGRTSDTGSDAAMANAPAASQGSASATSAPQMSASDTPAPQMSANATSAPQMSGNAAPASGEIQGRVEQVDPADHFVIAGSEKAGLGFDHFKADERTEVTIGGKKASLAEVQPGDEVRASFSGQGDALHVDKLQVTPRAGADDKAPARSGDDKR
jgi:hypothetical protein